MRQTRARCNQAVRATLLGALLLCASSALAEKIDFTGTPWAHAARPHGLDPALLYAITLVESRRTIDAARVSPWPWVIRTPTGGYWFNSRASAERGLRAVLAKRPARAVDVGIAQINLGWQQSRIDDPMKLLDLEYNLTLAAQILADAIDSSSDTVIGVGRYHHWASEARSRAYGERVWRTYRAVTFGHQNPAARYLVADEAGFVPVGAMLAEK